MLDKIAAMKERDDATTQFRLTAARLRATNADLLAALEALLPVAQAFEKQAGRGISSRRGGAVFTQARAAIAKARNPSQE